MFAITKSKTMEQGTIELVQRLFAAWNSKDVEQVLEQYADSFVREDLGNHRSFGKAELRQTVEAYYRAFPDLHLQVEKLLEQDDQVVICWTATGHHRGKIMKIPATGRQVSFKGISVLAVENGKIARVWYMWDEAGMLRQMGMLTDLRQAV